MSRGIVFGLDGKSMGEIHCNFPRGWAINDGGQTTITLPISAATAEWLEMGRMVLVEHPKLPSWCGMIDTPWTAIAPVKATLYNLGYLLHIRSLEEPKTFEGGTAQICFDMVTKVSHYEDLGIRPGDSDVDGSQKIKMTATPVWEQMLNLVKNNGMELQLRAGRDSNNKLKIWMDVKWRLGVNTGYLLHDGANHNIEITAATVDYEIYNRVVGLCSKGSGSDLYSLPQVDDSSVKQYRLRTQVIQFQNISSESQLNKLAATALAGSARPKLKLTVNILDVGNTYAQLGLGNTYVLHAANLVLPAGVKGWRGWIRLTAMAFDEETNRVAANLIADL